MKNRRQHLRIPELARWCRNDIAFLKESWREFFHKSPVVIIAGCLLAIGWAVFNLLPFLVEGK